MITFNFICKGVQGSMVSAAAGWAGQELIGLFMAELNGYVSAVPKKSEFIGFA